jgi:hypothetical protein
MHTHYAQHTGTTQPFKAGTEPKFWEGIKIYAPEKKEKKLEGRAASQSRFAAVRQRPSYGLVLRMASAVKHSHRDLQGRVPQQQKRHYINTQNPIEQLDTPVLGRAAVLNARRTRP